MLYILIDNYNVLIRYAAGFLNHHDIKMQKFGGLLYYFKLLEFLQNQYNNAIIVTFSDKCKSNFRHNLIDNYKKTRKPLSEFISLQLNYLHKYLIEANITNIYHENYEADDLIASFIHTHAGNEFIIVSTDKDILQLVNDENNIQVYNPFKRIYMRNQEIYEKYNVNAQHFALYQALMGDGSDNIPGIKGIGKVTAHKILKFSTNIATIIEVFNKQYDFNELHMYLKLTTLHKEYNLYHIPINTQYNITNVLHNINLLVK